MARKIKNPVVVSLTHAMAARLYGVLARRTYSHLESIVGDAIDCQAGPTVVLELSRKDAVEMHRLALNEVQIGGRLLTARQYDAIEKAFRKAYDARLRTMTAAR